MSEPSEVRIGANATAPSSQPRPSLRVRRNVSDEVTDWIRAGLLDRRIGPGERLHVEALANDIGVSPTPVREALMRLEAEGLVQRRPRQGYVARQLADRQTVEELYVVRLCIEPKAAALAAARASQQLVTELQALCRNRTPSPPGLPYDAYAQNSADNFQFHRKIAEASGVRLFAEILDRIAPQLPLYHAYHLHGAGAQSWEEHKAVVRALRRHDEDGAAAAMTAHLETSRNRIAHLFENADVVPDPPTTDRTRPRRSASGLSNPTTPRA